MKQLVAQRALICSRVQSSDRGGGQVSGLYQVGCL
jgi:hypothetical protein